MPDIKTKYRPKKFKRFLGNHGLIETLEGLVEDGSLPHAILLTGPRGCGKTTLGRIIKNELECSDADYKELDTAVFRGIGTVRTLRESLTFRPRNGKVKVYLIDEAHMLGKGGASEKNEAQNAILKSLEEPPEFVYWILCTTNPEMLIKTIPSRCTEFAVKPFDLKDTFKLLKRVTKGEKKKVDKKVMKKIHKVSEGYPRKALTLLAKIINLKSIKKQMDQITFENMEENALIIDLFKLLMKGKCWNLVAKTLRGLKGEDPETIRRSLMGLANAYLLNGNTDASLILGWFVYKPTYDTGFPMITQFCYNIDQSVEPPC